MFNKITRLPSAIRLWEECGVSGQRNVHFQHVGNKLKTEAETILARPHKHTKVTMAFPPTAAPKIASCANSVAPRRVAQTIIDGHELKNTSASPIWTVPTNMGKPTQKEELELPDYGDKLYLTPHIMNGSIQKAQELAKVGNLNNPVCDRKISEFGYSGFLTVKEQYNSNLFFWFFPAKVS